MMVQADVNAWMDTMILVRINIVVLVTILARLANPMSILLASPVPPLTN